MKVFIFINSINNTEFKKRVIKLVTRAIETEKQKPYIICADSGMNLAYPEIIPDILIGDFDSIDPAIFDAVKKNNVKIAEYPKDKDYTDYHLALRHALSAGGAIDEITVFGGLSGRLDQSLANLYLSACFSIENRLKISILEDNTGAYFLNSHFEVIELNDEIFKGDTISLRPLFLKASVESSEGLKYPLRNDTLYAIETRGISNEAEGGRVKIKLAGGELILIHIKKPHK